MLHPCSVHSAYPAGCPVQVTSYSPFRGLSGIIQAVDTLSGDGEEPFCFYLVDLEGTLTEEPMWFENDEVEVISSPLIALEAQANHTR